MPALKLPELSYRWGGFLASYPARLKWWCKNGFTNDSKWTEIIVRDVMNAFHGWSLECGEKCNDAGWDLCDKESKILVQVTNNCTHEKVENCLRGTCKRINKESEYQKFTLYIVFASIDEDAIDQLRKRAAIKMDKSIKNRKRGEELYDFSLENIEFDPEEHILSFDAFIQPVLADRISKDQKEQFVRVLDNFDSPFYLPREVCKLDPEERYRYYNNVDTICLGDIRNLLEDPTNGWAENLRARFGCLDLEVAKTRAPMPGGFEDQTKFLYVILPEGTATFIERQDAQTQSSIIEGTCHTNVLKEMLKPYRPSNGEAFRTLLRDCGAVVSNGLNVDILMTRLDFLEKLINGRDAEVSDVLRGLIMYCGYQYAVRKLAVFVFYAIAGRELFPLYGNKEYFTQSF